MCLLTPSMSTSKLPKRVSKTPKAIKQVRLNKLRSERVREREELRKRVLELYSQGLIQARIADELKITQRLVGSWLKEEGVLIPRKAKDPSKELAHDKATEVALVDEFHQELETTVDESIELSALGARDKEMEDLLEVARNQASPADKYQAYVAAAGMRMLRDNLMQVRGPRTIREMSELDQIIRRNLGLNPKQGGGGGAGGLTIDISILNNAKADKKHSIIKVKGKVMDADETDELEIGDEQ